MEKQYDFEILFDKLREAQTESDKIESSELQLIAEITNEIEYLREVTMGDINLEPITFTRS